MTEKATEATNAERSLTAPSLKIRPDPNNPEEKGFDLNPKAMLFDDRIHLYVIQPFSSTILDGMAEYLRMQDHNIRASVRAQRYLDLIVKIPWHPTVTIIALSWILRDYCDKQGFFDNPNEIRIETSA